MTDVITPTMTVPPTEPILHIQEAALLVAALTSPGQGKAQLGQIAATVLNDPLFEPTVRAATIERMEKLKYIQDGTVTAQGKKVLKKSAEVMGRLVQTLQMTGALA